MLEKEIALCLACGLGLHRAGVVHCTCPEHLASSIAAHSVSELRTRGDSAPPGSSFIECLGMSGLMSLGEEKQL